MISSLYYLALSRGGLLNYAAMSTLVVLGTLLLAGLVGWVIAWLWLSLTLIPFGLPLGHESTPYWLVVDRYRWLQTSVLLNVLGMAATFLLAGVVSSALFYPRDNLLAYLPIIAGMWLTFIGLRLLCETQFGQTSRALVFLPLGLLIIQYVNPNSTSFLFQPVVGLTLASVGICLFLISSICSDVERFIRN